MSFWPESNTDEIDLGDGMPLGVGCLLKQIRYFFHQFLVYFGLEMESRV